MLDILMGVWCKLNYRLCILMSPELHLRGCNVVYMYQLFGLVSMLALLLVGIASLDVAWTLIGAR